MLRGVMGDEQFFKVDEELSRAASPGSSVTHRRFPQGWPKQISGQNLQYFFIQWIESSGAPEFKLEYTVFRTQKGFRVMGKISQDLDTFHMPVDLKIETEGNPEEKRVEVVGTSSEFTVDTFGKPKSVVIDPNDAVLRFSPADARGGGDPPRRAVRGGRRVWRRAEGIPEGAGRQHGSSLAHYRVAEIFFLQNNYQSAANEFRESLNGDLDPKWTEVWAHIHLGKIFDITGQRDRAVNEYNHAIRTKDNTQGAQEEAAKYLKQPYERKASGV